MAEKRKNDFFKLLLGYENPEGTKNTRRTIGKRFYAEKLSGSVTQKTKRFLDSKPMKLLRLLKEAFVYATAKTYGIFFITFGVLSLLVQFAKDYFNIFGASSLSALIISALLSAVAIPLLLVDVPIPEALQRFKLTEIIFFEFFCIKRLYSNGNERALHPVAAFIAAVFLALLGAVVPLWCIVLCLGVILFASVTFLSPEFCFLSSLLFLPYFPLLPKYTLVIAVVALLGAVSFIRKTIFGKRVVFFEQYDLLLVIMVLAICTSGIFVKGIESFTGALLMAAMTLGYFLASNIVTNRRLADCAVNALSVSSIPAFTVSIVVFITDAVRGEPLKFLSDGISSTFSSGDSAAAFFIVAFIFSVILAKEASRAKRAIYSLYAVFNIFALILTGEATAVLALLFSVFAYYALKTRGWLALLLPLIFAFPYAFFLVPESALSRLPDFIYADGSIEVMRRSFEAFLDNTVLGIGIGTDCFVSEMIKYGVTGRTDSGNLFLELGLEAGIIALAAFVLLLIVRLVHRAYYQRYTISSHLSKLSPLVSVTVFSLLIYGTFDYIFSDMSILYLFFTVFGIAGASLRVAKQEHDDRVLYFEDEKSSTSSVVNIRID